MKKLFLTFAIAGLVFGFTSCGKKGGEKATDNTEAAADADSDPVDGATDMDEEKPAADATNTDADAGDSADMKMDEEKPADDKKEDADKHADHPADHHEGH